MIEKLGASSGYDIVNDSFNCITKQLNRYYYESYLWDSFLYATADADFTGLAVTLQYPDIL